MSNGRKGRLIYRRWQHPDLCLAPGALVEDDPRLAELLAGVAWDGFRREGRGAVLLPLGPLEVGDVAPIFVPRRELAQISGESVECLYTYNPRRQLILGTYVGSHLMPVGAEITLRLLNPSPPPPAAYRRLKMNLPPERLG